MPTEREVWDTIADSWTNVRVKPEKEVIDFSRKINSGPILDVGCGSCRNSLPFLERNIKCFGLDFSKGMIREAKIFLRRRELKMNFVIADMTNIPFKSKSFLAIIFVRALPHLETRKKRLECLGEVKRVGIKTIISCWYRWDRRLFWISLKSLFSNDVYIDWKYHGKIYKRFHHLYTKKELEEDIKKVRFKIEKIWVGGGNIWSLVNV
jgi:ubiquinone/menaquinone biosynthesis C-methylase UbiE